MTTIITRLYKDDSAANAVVSGLKEAGFPENTYTKIEGGGDVAAAMADAKVGEEAAAAYAPLIGQGNKLVVVRAPFVPYAAATTAMKIADSQEAVDAGLDNENVLVSYEMTGRLVPSIQRDQHYGDFWFPLLSKRKPHWNTVFSGTKRFGAFLVPLLSDRKPMANSLMPSSTRFGNYILPLTTEHKSWAQSVFHGTKRFGDFLAPLIIRR